MSYILVGLGNPGEEYLQTRHNTGRIVLESFLKTNDFEELTANKTYKALISEGKIGKNKFTIILPETFMNKSGESLRKLITSAKKAKDLVVVQDDLDLPIGRFKISFNRGSGGHRGVESIIKAIKTEAFIRIRVGISPASVKGVAKKPVGGEAVEKHILGKFSEKEMATLKKVSKDISEAIKTLAEEGIEVAMGKYNG